MTKKDVSFRPSLTSILMTRILMGNDMHLDQDSGGREYAAKDKPFQNHSNTTLFCPNCFLKSSQIGTKRLKEFR